MNNAAGTANIGSERILIVDSDVTSRLKWSRMLEIMGFQVRQAGSGEEALAQLELAPVELAFFDLPLPDINDPELLHHARGLSSEMLIIVQNSQPTIESTVAAIKAGATDYLIGLANSQRVVDAITSALRNKAREKERQNELLGRQVETYLTSKGMDRDTVTDELPSDRQLVAQGSFYLDRQTRRLTLRDDEAIQAELTKGESDVLGSLMIHPGTVLSCREIVRAAFRYESPEDEAQSVIRPYISRLRRKLAEAGFQQQPITTVRGCGYMFVTSLGDDR